MRQRDLLPLPEGHLLQGIVSDASDHRKVSGEARHWLGEGVKSLNQMGAAEQPRFGDRTPSLCQRVAVAQLAVKYASVPPCSSKVSGPEALRGLLGEKTGYSGTGQVAAGALATYQPGRLSLPVADAGKVDLLEVIPSDLHDRLCSERRLFRDSKERDLLLSEAPPVALDIGLARRGKVYGKFISELWRKGIVELGARSLVKEETGMFCVRRKDDKLRLICDTRRSNMHFLDPPHTELSSPESLSELDMGSCDQIYLEQGDVEVCFFQ